MPVAVVKSGDKVLLRKMDPERSPYKQLWALFGGRIEDSEGAIIDSLNQELSLRWNFTVSILERLWWDEETKTDQDSEEKRFVYLDTICEIKTGEPRPINEKEILEWVQISDLESYDLNPPTTILLKRLGYL